jgi:hypothetical protein
LMKKFTVAVELWHFYATFLRGNAVGNLMTVCGMLKTPNP